MVTPKEEFKNNQELDAPGEADPATFHVPAIVCASPA